jgi:hypothetical protein
VRLVLKVQSESPESKVQKVIQETKDQLEQQEPLASPERKVREAIKEIKVHPVPPEPKVLKE